MAAALRCPLDPRRGPSVAGTLGGIAARGQHEHEDMCGRISFRRLTWLERIKRFQHCGHVHPGRNDHAAVGRYAGREARRHVRTASIVSPPTQPVPQQPFDVVGTVCGVAGLSPAVLVLGPDVVRRGIESVGEGSLHHRQREPRRLRRDEVQPILVLDADPPGRGHHASLIGTRISAATGNQ